MQDLWSGCFEKWARWRGKKVTCWHSLQNAWIGSYLWFVIHFFLGNNLYNTEGHLTCKTTFKMNDLDKWFDIVCVRALHVTRINFVMALLIFFLSTFACCWWFFLFVFFNNKKEWSSTKSFQITKKSENLRKWMEKSFSTKRTVTRTSRCFEKVVEEELVYKMFIKKKERVSE